MRHIFNLDWNNVLHEQQRLTGLEVHKNAGARIDCVPIKVQTVAMIDTENHWSTY